MAVRGVIFDDRRLAQCVGCGMCLPSCPTFQMTHLEQHGPRGRIMGMRLVQTGELAPDDPEYVDSMETCVQCRACEPVCPSRVEFGPLMEQARADLTRRRRVNGRRQALEDGAFWLLTRRGCLHSVSVGLSVLQGLGLDRLLPERLRVPLRLRLGDLRRPVQGSAGQRPALLFRGCVMDQWFRPVHRATVKILAGAGYAVRVKPAPPCCGALHLHAGRRREALRLAHQVVASYAGTAGPIVVNSAGCGAVLKEYGRLLDTPEAETFASRVRDLAELDMASLPQLRTVPLTVAYQAACHLRNVQRLDDAHLRLLRGVPGLTVLEPDEAELCCGAGGAYSVLRPDLSNALGERKARAIAATGCQTIVSANPGCALQLARRGFTVQHPAEILADALPE